MFQSKKIVVVLPAFNAHKTLKDTYSEIPFEIVDEVVLVDDASDDETIKEARKIGIKHLVIHDQNKGYGANQKSCYDKALELDADVIVMLHPDYQYPPKLITSMIPMITGGEYDLVLGSRILGNGALKGGMPMYKYVSNRALTFFQNLLSNQKLSEYHTGYRVYSREVLESLSYSNNSDDFIFDNQIIAQAFAKGFRIGEVSCPTNYFEEASSINFRRSVRYGLGVVWVSVRYFLHRLGWKWSLME
ncbi:MAG: glycosyltransferase family 2 protein [Cyclobacteriaceae bacterium]